MRFTLAPGQEVTYPAKGRFLFVKEATGPLDVQVETGEGHRSGYPLEKNDQVEFPGRLARVTLENRHTLAQVVEVFEGEGIFHPNQDGQQVVLTGQDLAIEVSTNPANPLDVLGPLTDAELRATPVNVLGPLTDAELRATPVDVQVVMYGTNTPGAVLTGAGPHVIPANPNRKFLIIKALKANTGIGWTAGALLSGDAIENGERVQYETTGAMTITPTVAGDNFAVLEIEV